MSWGKKIVFLYLGFVGLMTFLVVMSFRQNTDLVNENYYADELIYQQQIDASKNAQGFVDAITITLLPQVVQIQFPPEFVLGTTGEIYFYKASDAKSDVKIPLALDENGQQKFSRSAFSTGFYSVKIKWMKENKKYYLEKNIVL